MVDQEKEATLKAFEHGLQWVASLEAKTQRLRPFLRRRDPSGRQHELYEKARLALEIARGLESRTARDGAIKQARMWRELARVERDTRIELRRRKEEEQAAFRNFLTESGERPTYVDITDETPIVWNENRYIGVRR